MHDLLLEQGLGRYYELARGEVTPVASSPGVRSHTWLEPLVEQAQASAQGELCALTLDVQGIHCAACVWLMNETYRRETGAQEITVNPALGKVRLLFKKGETDLSRWVKAVEGFGYQFGPARKETSKKSIDLPLRLGISAAITINVMLFPEPLLHRRKHKNGQHPLQLGVLLQIGLQHKTALAYYLSNRDKFRY